MLAIALSLGSSLVYGVSDFLGGLKSRSLPLVSVLLVSQASGLFVTAVIVAASSDGPPAGEFVAYGVAAGLSEALGVAALYRGLATGVMSIVAPIASLAPLVPVVAAIVLGELPSALQSAGIALALAGIVIISYSRAGEGAERDPRRSVVFGLLTALGFGGYLVAMDASSEGHVAWALFVARLTAVGAFAAIFLARRQPLGVSPAELPVLALIGALIIGADAMYAVATTEGLLSVVAVLSSLYPVVTIALARIVLDERIGRAQQLGIAAALCGVVTISA